MQIKTLLSNQNKLMRIKPRKNPRTNVKSNPETQTKIKPIKSNEI